MHLRSPHSPDAELSCRRSLAQARARIFAASRLSASGTTAGLWVMHSIGHTCAQMSQSMQHSGSM